MRQSDVVPRSKASPRHYAMLGDLNTRPRTTYLARVLEAPPGSDGRGVKPLFHDGRADKPHPMTAGSAVLEGRAGATPTIGDKISAIVLERAALGLEMAAWPSAPTGFAVHARVPRPPSATCSARASASGASTSRWRWGFAIANCVWWIGIGHAGTFISAVLLLLRQKWRTSINRFAEAMTLFAAWRWPASSRCCTSAGPGTSTGSCAVPRTPWVCGRNGAARWSGISSRSRPTSSSRSCSGTSA